MKGLKFIRDGPLLIMPGFQVDCPRSASIPRKNNIYFVIFGLLVPTSLLEKKLSHVKKKAKLLEACLKNMQVQDICIINEIR